MKHINTILFFLLTLIIFTTSCKSDKIISFESLLNEIVDREVLPYYPDPFYITRQFSSYDRASVSPDEPGWFANWDRSNFIREEFNNGRKEYVMMETEGPGAIVRFWMTFARDCAGQGTLRIYFDNEEEPTIEGVALEVLSGGQLTGGPLSCSVSPSTVYERRGHNLYLPLPYSENVKITYESDNIIGEGGKSGGESVYYNINYRTYERGTKVKTFTIDKLDLYRTTLDLVSEKLDKRDQISYLNSIPTSNIILGGIIEPGSMIEHKISGRNAIREILLQLNADDLNQALRSVVIEIEFDGNKTVWCPAGDFFGTGYQVRMVDTWYTQVSEEGLMRSWWVMPFRNNAVFRLHNMGDEPVSIENGRLTFSDWQWNSRSMHFGATWINYTKLYTGERKTHEGDGNPFDLNFTHIKGEGMLVGDVLTLFNTNYAWWGEGDEKIYIDGEDFPSHFGTGTEDYYGYAWCRPEIFNEPFIAQPDGSGNFLPGYTVNLRYRSLDALPFASEIIFDMEMWHSGSTWIDYAPATFFYIKPGGEILINPDIEGAQKKVALKREDIISPWIEDDAIEGENLIEVFRENGKLNFPWNDLYGWSSDKYLLWRDITPGNELHLGFKSLDAGIKNINAILATGTDYGIFEISVNDSAPIPCNSYNPDGFGLKKFPLGTHYINEGLNDIVIRLVETGPSQKRGFFGLDIIKFN